MRRAVKLTIKDMPVTGPAAERLIESCPFSAIEYASQRLSINSNCRLCGLCVKADTTGALEMVYESNEMPAYEQDAADYRGVAVFMEISGGRVAPVSLELLGKALELAGGEPVYMAAAGYNIKNAVHELSRYGASAIYVYDSPELEFFEVTRYSLCLCDFVERFRPSSFLIGATGVGRSLAPRVAAAFRTGLTADCTGLEMEDGLLIQTRPAFGGNIMARIVTKTRRPQICTVRYRVFDTPPPRDKLSDIKYMQVPDLTATGVKVLFANRRPQSADISEAERIVAVGRGAADARGLALCGEFADLLGAQLACSRPLAETGVFEQRRQIGLSGRIVKPKLLVTVGVSGAVQFTSAAAGAEQIIAINPDRTAPIFKCAHHGYVGRAHEVIPAALQYIKDKNIC